MQSVKPLRLKRETYRLDRIADSPNVAHVWVDTGLSHLDGLYTYRIPNDLLNSVAIGSRLRVPFNSRSCEAIVVELSISNQSSGNLKVIKYLEKDEVDKATKIAWDGLIPALQTNEIDVIIAGMSPTDERRQTIDFSDPYYRDEPTMSVVVNKNTKFVGAKELKDLDVLLIDVTSKEDNKSFDMAQTIINKMVDNCLDLQSEAKDYENIDLKIHKKKKNDLQKDILDNLNNLDIYETKLLKNSNNINYLLMLCSRN